MSAKKSSKSAKAKGKTDPAALLALIRMMMANEQGEAPPGGPMGAPAMAGPPPWRANRPPILSPGGTPPLLG